MNEYNIDSKYISMTLLIERFRMTQAHLRRRPPSVHSPLYEEINNPRIDGITRSKAIKAMHFYFVSHYVFTISADM